MKTILFLLSLLILVSCKEEEIQAFKDLDSDEQDAIRQMGTKQCKKRVASTFESFRKSSNGFFKNSKYDRETAFKFVLKEGTSEKKVIEAKIWKNTSSEIYFYVSDDSEVDYFLRVTKAENEQMIEDLMEAYCSRPEIYTGTVNSSSFKLVNKYKVPRAPNYEEYEDTYYLSSDYPAFFANYRMTRRTKKVFDAEDDDQIGSTVTFTSTMTKTKVEFNSNLPTSGQYNQLFCTIKRDPATGYRLSRDRNYEGFRIYLNDTNPATQTCFTTIPADWNLTI